jgi:glycosyltransferase involved in cell wall biosynthesis
MTSAPSVAEHSDSQEVISPTGGDSPIRLLLIAPSMEIVGGQSVQANYLLSMLHEVPGLRVTFFPLDPYLPKALRWTRRVPYLRTFVNSVLYNSRLLREARKHDLIHIFSAGLSSYTLWTIPALTIARLYRKKTILHYHDGQGEQHLREWRSAKPTIALADRVITPSGFLVDVFAKYGIRAQSIFNVLDVSHFRYRKRRKLRPVFMTNRILEPLYNVGCILRAFAIIQKRYPDASLTIAHDGVCRPSLEQLARELELRNTEFIGKVSRENIPDLYDAADIYLTSPNIDCMPVSLLECFASGLPIVATKAGGIPYIVKHRESALLVDLNDHEALAERAMELLEDEKLVERLTDRGLEEVKRYRREPIKQQWAELYRELAS